MNPPTVPMYLNMNIHDFGRTSDFTAPPPDSPKRIKHKKKSKKSLPKTPSLQKSETLYRPSLSKQEYINVLSAPRQSSARQQAQPPPEKGPKKKQKQCSPRLAVLARPNKLRVLETWKKFKTSLPPDFTARLEELLYTDYSYDPDFAENSFKVQQHLKEQELRSMSSVSISTEMREGKADSEYIVV